MLEFIGSGVIGSLFGGLFRLAPEVLKFFDKQNDRKHELAMMDKQLDYEKLKAEFNVEEKYVDFSVHQLDAMQEAFKEQAATATSSYKWVSALSALVRPVVTYVLFGLYVCFKIAMMYYAVQTGIPWNAVMQQAWNPDDFAMLNGILFYWFLNRSIERYRK